MSGQTLGGQRLSSLSSQGVLVPGTVFPMADLRVPAFQGTSLSGSMDAQRAVLCDGLSVQRNHVGPFS